MVFPKNSAKGKAGENYFAYWILRNFGWPCRLLDIDIGIDAQIEVLNQNNVPTGNCLPVQIKTTESKELKLQVSTEHLSQWSRMNEPVLLILIDFKANEPKIYYKNIQSEEIQTKILESINDESESKIFWFEDKELLTINHKSEFTSISYLGMDKSINAISQSLIDNIILNINYFETEDDSWFWIGFNNVDFTDVMHDYSRCCFMKDKIEIAVSKRANLVFSNPSVEKSLEFFENFKIGILSLLEQINNKDEKHFHKNDLLRNDFHYSLKTLIEDTIK